MHDYFILVGMALFITLLLCYDSGSRASPKAQIKAHKKAKYPDVDKRLLFDTPQGVIFGMSEGKYVCKPLEYDGHVFLIGGSGTGKSSCHVIPTITRAYHTDIAQCNYNFDKFDDSHNASIKIDVDDYIYAAANNTEDPTGHKPLFNQHGTSSDGTGNFTLYALYEPVLKAQVTLGDNANGRNVRTGDNATCKAKNYYSGYSFDNNMVNTWKDVVNTNKKPGEVLDLNFASGGINQNNSGTNKNRYAGLTGSYFWGRNDDDGILKTSAGHNVSYKTY